MSELSHEHQNDFCLNNGLLVSLPDGELTDEERSRAQWHLAHCPDCATSERLVRNRSQEVGQSLALLDPLEQQIPEAEQAFARFQSRLDRTPGRDEQEVLALVNLTGRERQRLGTFSKGMLQRIGLAQALIGKPELLILDELMSGLDPLSQRELRQALRRFKAGGTTILLNSHQLADVEELCDRVAIIHHGQILRMGTLAELFDQNVLLEVEVDYVDRELIHRLGTFALSIQQVPESPGHLLIEVEGREHAAEIAALIQACGVRLYALTPHMPSLEELFFRTFEEACADDD
jgi:ABC-type multidrug transport system ATPase subunit